MTAQREPEGAGGAAQRRAYDASRGDRDRALEAMSALEAAAGKAGPGRDESWRADVMTAIRRLQEAIDEQQASYADPGSLMARIASDEPRLRTWVRQLHHRWADLATTTASLAETIQAPEAGNPWTVADVREQLRWLLTALHHHRAREADLIFEALGIDIASG